LILSLVQSRKLKLQASKLQFRSKLTLVFLASIAILAVGLLAIFVYFALPGPDWAVIGTLSDFPPSETPYEIREPAHVYLVNDGERVIALDPLYRATGGYIVQWHAPDQSFIDPSTGAWFNLYGEPARWAERGLERYPVRMDDGEIWVDLSKQR